MAVEINSEKMVRDVIVVGASAGGFHAVIDLLARLPAELPAFIGIVIHRGAASTSNWSTSLGRKTKLTVVEPANGDRLKRGVVYIAPGDRHLLVVQRGASIVTKLNDAPPENSCRPAVDVLFRSVARVYGRSALAVVLTGMGQDGRRGGMELSATGAEIVAQDEQSSVVWGMPGAIVNNGLANAVLPLDDVAAYLISRAAPARTARARVVA